MQGALLVAPVLIPLASALAAILLASRPRAQEWVSLAGAFALLCATIALFVRVAASGPLRLAFGGWAAPFGIEFVADGLSALMILVTALMVLCSLLFQRCGVDAAPPSGTLLPLCHALVAGVGGAFLTADLFNLYVWFEVMLIAALGLLAHGLRPRNLEAALKYFVLNVAGTLFLLIAIAGIYGLTGQLNFRAIEVAAASLEPGRLLPFVALLSLALLVKAGAFPLFAWLPASYHTLPAPVLALFSALLTKVGVYAVLRTLGGIFHGAPSVLFEALGWIGAATMLVGVLVAAYHWDMRRILAVHIVSQIGYMLVGIAMASPMGRTGAIFYMVHNILVKSNLFLIAGIVFRLAGSYDLRRIGGLYAVRPWLSILFLLSALSLVGIPPLSGFFGKLILVQECFSQGYTAWGVTALLVGFLTLYSMSKIWTEAFWKKHPDGDGALSGCTRLTGAYLVVALLTALSLAIGLAPETLLGLAERAAGGLASGGP